MFNPEKILGNLLLSGARRSSGVSGGALLGLVGVAMEAVEHYMNQDKRSGSAPGPAPGMPPPPPPGAGPQAPPSAQPPPPPPAPGSGPEMSARDKAVLLIRAMIAAAAADGDIDNRERSRIMDQAGKSGLSEEERDFLEKEMANPRPLETIVSQVDSPELAARVYAVSLAALEVDTEAERQYLRNLAGALGLTAEQVAGIEQRLG